MKSSVYSIFEDVNETNFPCFKQVYFQLDYEVKFPQILLHILMFFIFCMLCTQAKWLECTQEPNEIIFVPSGWYHQVHNLV